MSKFCKNRLDGLGPRICSTIEEALATPTNEETELSSSPAGQASGSTQTEENALAMCSARRRKRRIT